MDPNEVMCHDMVCDYRTEAEVDQACADSDWTITITVLGIFGMVYDYLLKTCAECGCVQNTNKYLEVSVSVL